MPCIKHLSPVGALFHLFQPHVFTHYTYTYIFHNPYRGTGCSLCAQRTGGNAVPGDSIWLKVELEALCSCQNALSLLLSLYSGAPGLRSRPCSCFRRLYFLRDIFGGSRPPQTSNQQPFVRVSCCNCLFPRSSTLVQTPGGTQPIADFESTTTHFCHSHFSSSSTHPTLLFPQARNFRSLSPMTSSSLRPRPAGTTTQRRGPSRS